MAAGLAAQSVTPEARSSAYVLGPEDLVAIHVLLIPEIPEKPVRIESDGYINLPLAGRVRAGGLTASELEGAIAERLRDVLNSPQVVVDLVEQRSQPVSVLGAVKNPGVHQLRGPKSLIEMLSIAGGVEPDAGSSVRIARRKEQGAMGLPQEQPDATGEFIVAEVRLAEVMDGRHPAGNVTIKPHDVITVPRAKLVYAIGEVKKPGGFVLRERESISVLQVLSLAEGLNRTAGPAHARVLRPDPAGGQRQEIAVNLNDILAGKTGDVMLQPDDILFVPNSAAKSGALRALEAAIQMGTGVVVWGRF